MIKLFNSNVFNIYIYCFEYYIITKIIGTIFIVEWEDYEGLPIFFFQILIFYKSSHNFGIFINNFYFNMHFFITYSIFKIIISVVR